MELSKITAAVILLLLAGDSTASATTYIPISDPDLADQAAAIARVKVLEAAPGPANRAPATDYLVEVDELVQGYLQGSTLVVRVPGGVRANGVGLQIWGAPEFEPGEEVLLFLQPNADGTYGLLHLMLGAFHARLAGARKLAEQDLAEAHSLSTGGVTGEAVRDLDRFAAWLADRAAGMERTADYWVARPNNGPEKAYTTLETPDNVPFRWFDFDAGRSVSWRVNSGGQPGLTLDQTVASFQAALDAWTSDPTSSINYVYAGLTGAAGGLGASDKVNAILFNDPHGQVPGAFSCKTGGVVAIGGSYFYASTRSFRGQSYHDSFEADVVTNEGTECFFANNPRGAAEVFAHELGHTLGFGHATDAQALMWAKAHNDGRGARLGEDERVGASTLYGDGSYRPAPAGPFTLTASAARTEIQLSWNHPFRGVESFQVESQQKKGAFKVLMTVPGSGSTATVGGLKLNQSYTLRITALRPGGAAAGSSNVVRVRTRK
jgi:matrixin/fibronectin type III domain protein